MVRFLGVGVLACVLWGCAAPPPAPLGDRMWQDAVFHYQPALVQETAASLFHLDADTLESLRSKMGKASSSETKINRLINSLYSEQGIRIAYVGGHTTGAMQTWQSRKGDCMSLTILTYALTKELGIRAVMQQVDIAPVFDRRDDAEFVSHHVNVYVPAREVFSIDGRSYESPGLVVDFLPQPGSRVRGMALSEDQILARFYNNRGSEHLTQKRDDAAYAYYRAAIAADPHYGPAYSNLAQLYLRRGLQPSAESLLWHAVALDRSGDSPLRSLHALLLAQSRGEEAQKVAVMLERIKEQNPYHWLKLGIAALQKGELRRSISALERAEALAVGFEEIHYHLALAYARNGQRDKATQQINALDAINHHDPNIALLNKKLQSMEPKSRFF